MEARTLRHVGRRGLDDGPQGCRGCRLPNRGAPENEKFVPEPNARLHWFERIQQIEQRINGTIAVGEQCSPISGFHLSKSPSREWAPEVTCFHPYYDPDIASPPMIDCMVEALACDRTRDSPTFCRN